MIRLLRQMWGSTPAADFGPNRLRLIRDQMILGDTNADPPRRPWPRKTVNHNVHRLIAMFKWAASHEMVPAAVYERLKTVRDGTCLVKRNQIVEFVGLHWAVVA